MFWNHTSGAIFQNQASGATFQNLPPGAIFRFSKCCGLAGVWRAPGAMFWNHTSGAMFQNQASGATFQNLPPDARLHQIDFVFPVKGWLGFCLIFEKKTKFNKMRYFVKLQWHFFYPTFKWFKNSFSPVSILHTCWYGPKYKLTNKTYALCVPFVFFRDFVFFIRVAG